MYVKPGFTYFEAGVWQHDKRWGSTTREFYDEDVLCWKCNIPEIA
jgi:hypothetical protein